jgi:hypothetical protein
MRDMCGPATLVVTAFAAAAALLLTTCGNSGASSGTIKGARMGTSPSASPSASAGPAATAHFDIPSDIKTIIDADSTGDENKDAVLQAQANAQLAFLQAAAHMDPQSPALNVYYADSAKSFYVQQITQVKKPGTVDHRYLPLLQPSGEVVLGRGVSRHLLRGPEQGFREGRQDRRRPSHGSQSE